MTDTDALDAGLLAERERLINIAQDMLIEFDVDMLLDNDKSDQLRDNIVAALRAERVRGEVSMRERAANVADEYKAKMAAAQERLGALGRASSIAECKEDAADWLAAAIRALPTTDQETTHG